jgi:hypothetical protein
MNTQAVTIHLPTTLYKRMQHAAQVQQRPIETLLLDAVTASAPLLEDLPAELAEEMAALTLLNDAALWQVAQRTLSEEQQQDLDELLYAKGRGSLAPEDQQRLDALLAEYEHVVLARAQAAVLLQLRGYDVSDPAALTPPAV